MSDESIATTEYETGETGHIAQVDPSSPEAPPLAEKWSEQLVEGPGYSDPVMTAFAAQEQGWTSTPPSPDAEDVPAEREAPSFVETILGVIREKAAEAGIQVNVVTEDTSSESDRETPHNGVVGGTMVEMFSLVSEINGADAIHTRDGSAHIHVKEIMVHYTREQGGEWYVEELALIGVLCGARAILDLAWGISPRGYQRKYAGPERATEGRQGNWYRAPEWARTFALENLPVKITTRSASLESSDE